jgi:hypothetical protein
LFGSDTIDIPGTEHIAKEAEADENVGKTLKLKNDVIGYYNGANFKRHKVVLPKSIGGKDCLATDTPKYIPIISNYTTQFGIETIVMPQDRVEKGVTLSIKQGEKCAKGWYDMLLDDILLSFSDVLIAARHSTFTQSMPMPLVFDRSNGVPGPHFCEVGDSGMLRCICPYDLKTYYIM